METFILKIMMINIFVKIFKKFIIIINNNKFLSGCCMKI